MNHMIKAVQAMSQMLSTSTQRVEKELGVLNLNLDRQLSDLEAKEKQVSTSLNTLNDSTKRRLDAQAKAMKAWL